MKRLIFGLLLALGVLFVPSEYAIAKNSSSVQRVQYNADAHANFRKKISTVKLRFNHLKNIAKVNYEIVYDFNGVMQGVDGSELTNGVKNIKKDVFLGTCSQGVCINHTSAKNITLKVVFHYINGNEVVRFYAVK